MFCILNGQSNSGIELGCPTMLECECFLTCPNLSVEILTLRVIVPGGGTFGKLLCHKDKALQNGNSVLMKQTLESFITSLP